MNKTLVMKVSVFLCVFLLANCNKKILQEDNEVQDSSNISLSLDDILNDEKLAPIYYLGYYEGIQIIQEEIKMATFSAKNVPLYWNRKKYEDLELAIKMRGRADAWDNIAASLVDGFLKYDHYLENKENELKGTSGNSLKNGE